jgi:tetratricopeptide (TPR) repeat protein
LGDAERVLTQAVTTGGQQDNAAAWYYLGRRFVLLADPVGADSVFRRAEQLAPNCAEDIGAWRRFLWAGAYNTGVRAYREGHVDSAIHHIRRATVAVAEPSAMSVLAVLFANSGEIDSAVHYYAGVIRTAEAQDTMHQRLRREAMFNRGAIFNQTERWAESEAAFREFLAENPGDVQALAGLAAAYSQTGRMDSALAVYRLMLTHADEAEPRHLFAAGVTMFNAAPAEPDSSAIWTRCRDANRPSGRVTPAQTRQIAATCGAAARDSMAAWRTIAHEYFRGAAQAFESGLARNPGSRDALFNLVNTYYRIQDSVKMLTVAQRLYAADPLNRHTIRLLAAAWRLRGEVDSTLRYLAIADTGIVAEVSVTSFILGDADANVIGLATNVSQERASPPFTLVFDFLDAKGAVVATASAPVPALEAGGMHKLDVRVEGAGILAWRYRKE